LNWKYLDLTILRRNQVLHFPLYDLLSLFTKPFQSETFDFSDEVFFENIALLGERQRPKSQKDEWKSWIQAFYLH
jgi:hypothetical protein